MTETTADGKKIMTFGALEDPAYVEDIKKVTTATRETNRGFLAHCAAMDEMHKKHGYSTAKETFDHCMATTQMDPMARILLTLTISVLEAATKKQPTVPPTAAPPSSDEASRRLYAEELAKLSELGFR